MISFLWNYQTFKEKTKATLYLTQIELAIIGELGVKPCAVVTIYLLSTKTDECT